MFRDPLTPGGLLEGGDYYFEVAEGNFHPHFRGKIVKISFETPISQCFSSFNALFTGKLRTTTSYIPIFGVFWWFRCIPPIPPGGLLEGGGLLFRDPPTPGGLLEGTR